MDGSKKLRSFSTPSLPLRRPSASGLYSGRPRSSRKLGVYRGHVDVGGGRESAASLESRRPRLLEGVRGAGGLRVNLVVPGAAEELNQALAELAAVERVDHRVHGRIERHQHDADLVRDRAEALVGAERRQQLDDQVRRPADRVDDRHDQNHLGDAFARFEHALLGNGQEPLVREPQREADARVQHGHDSDWNPTADKDARDAVRFVEQNGRQTPQAIVALLHVLDRELQRENENESERPHEGGDHEHLA